VSLGVRFIKVLSTCANDTATREESSKVR